MAIVNHRVLIQHLTSQFIYVICNLKVLWQNKMLFERRGESVVEFLSVPTAPALTFFSSGRFMLCEDFKLGTTLQGTYLQSCPGVAPTPVHCTSRTLLHHALLQLPSFSLHLQKLHKWRGKMTAIILKLWQTEAEMTEQLTEQHKPGFPSTVSEAETSTRQHSELLERQ